jgi:flavorubredoxin
MARTLTYVKGLRPLNKKGFAFGSYGWAEKGATLVDSILEEMVVEKIMPPLTIRFKPDAQALKVCYDAGVKMSELAASC